MKFKYSADVDILMVHLSDEPIDYADETAGVIVHLSKRGDPVLLEIQGGKEFVVSSLLSMLEDREVEIP